MIRKIILSLCLTAFSVPVMADDQTEHSAVRYFESPEISLSETMSNGFMAGTFRGMQIWLGPDEKDDGYTGFVMREKEKLPVRIAYENKRLKADFNGNVFSFDSLDAGKGVYNFKTSSGVVSVSIIYETKAGKHMMNPVFIIKKDKRNYIVRLRGESCYGHGLYYAAVLYGFTTLDSSGDKSISEKSEDKDLSGKNVVEKK